MIRHEADRGEVLFAAVEVLHPRQAVGEVVGIQLLLAADVEQDRQPGLLRLGPDRLEGDVAR